jgi:hypothetical protein
MKKILFSALLLSMAIGCKKDAPVGRQQVSYQLLTTPYYSFGGYEFHQAGFDFYQEIVVDDPDPNTQMQELNEKLLYVGIALNAAQCQLHDVNSNALAALDTIGEKGGTTVFDFFQSHSAYQLLLDSVLNHYSVSTSNFYDPVIMNGYNMVPGLRVQENAINATRNDAVIAMGIEVKPPHHDESEDYEEDFIPAYFPLSNEEGECSIETVVGYDDAFDDYDTYPLENQLGDNVYTILIVVGVEVDENGVIANKTEINPKEIATNITKFTGSNCEAAQELETSYGISKTRWQRRGFSRVRVKHLMAIGAPSTVNKAKEKFNFCNLSKQYFDSPYAINTSSNPAINSDVEEIEAVDQAVIWPPLHNQDAIGTSGIIVVYEDDWYGWPRTAFWQPDPNNNIKVKLLFIQQKSPWEYYAHAIIDPMDWCHDSYIIRGYYNNLSEVKFRGN